MRISPSEFEIFLEGIGTHRTSFCPPPEWNPSPLLITTVLIATQEAELPDSGRRE